MKVSFMHGMSRSCSTYRFRISTSSAEARKEYLNESGKESDCSMMIKRLDWSGTAELGREI